MPLLIPIATFIGSIVYAIVKAIVQSKVLLAILAAIVAIGILLPQLFGWFWGKVFESIRDFVLYLFDPIVIVDAAFLVLSWLVGFIGWLVPGVVGDKITAFGTWIHSVPFSNILNVVFWFMQPLASAAMVIGCIRAVLMIWVFTMLLRIAMLFKTQLPGGGSSS